MSLPHVPGSISSQELFTFSAVRSPNVFSLFLYGKPVQLSSHMHLGSYISHALFIVCHVPDI